MKRKKVLLIVGGLGLTATALYLIFRKKPNTVVGSIISSVKQKVSPSYNLPTTTGSTTSTNTSTTTSSTTTSEVDFPLKSGSRGTNVKSLQIMINSLYIDKIGIKLVEDGIWGPKTGAAVKTATGLSQISKKDFDKLSKAYWANIAMSPFPS